MALNGGGGGASARAIEAGRAFVRLGGKDDLTAFLKRSAAKLTAFGKTVIGATGIGGLLGGVVGGLGFKETADDIRRMNDAVKALGMSATGGSGLFGVLGQFSDLGENVEGITQFNQKVTDAFDGTGEEAKKLFDGLSVSAADLIDLPLEEKFFRIHAAIRELPQAQQQFKLSMLGGTDSMKKWLPLLDMSNEELRRQAGELAFNAEEMDRAAAASKAMREAGAAVNRVWQQAVIVLAPLVTQLAKLAADGLKPVTEFLKDRTLEDLGAEALARLNQLWVEAKHGAIGVWAGVWDFFTGGWDAAVLVVKGLFADLGRFAVRSITAAVRLPLSLLAKVDPERAKQISAALGAVGGATDAGLEDARRQALADFDRAEEARNAARGERQAEAGRERDAARAELDRLDRERKQRVRQRQWDELLNTPVGGAAVRQRAAAVGRSLAVLGGGGSFLSQGFGVQAGEAVAKEQLKEQKKANVKLGDVVKAIENIPVPRFF